LNTSVSKGSLPEYASHQNGYKFESLRPENYEKKGKIKISAEKSQRKAPHHEGSQGQVVELTTEAKPGVSGGLVVGVTEKALREKEDIPRTLCIKRSGKRKYHRIIHHARKRESSRPPQKKKEGESKETPKEKFNRKLFQEKKGTQHNLYSMEKRKRSWSCKKKHVAKP